MSFVTGPALSSLDHIFPRTCHKLPVLMRASNFTSRQAPSPARFEPEAVDAERQQLLALRHRELARELGRCGRADAGAKALHTTS